MLVYVWLCVCVRVSVCWGLYRVGWHLSEGLKPSIHSSHSIYGVCVCVCVCPWEDGSRRQIDTKRLSVCVFACLCVCAYACVCINK